MNASTRAEEWNEIGISMNISSDGNSAMASLPASVASAYIVMKDGLSCQALKAGFPIEDCNES